MDYDDTIDCMPDAKRPTLLCYLLGIFALLTGG